MSQVTKRKSSKGFTLIELMIAIAIVGVLAAVALPAFANYLARARVTEAVNYAQSCKTGVLEYFSAMGRLPANNTEANCPTISTENVETVGIAGGVITVTFQGGDNSALPPALRGESIQVRPLDAANAVATAATSRIVAWDCIASNADILDYMPAECRQTN